MFIGRNYILFLKAKTEKRKAEHLPVVATKRMLSCSSDQSSSIAVSVSNMPSNLNDVKNLLFNPPKKTWRENFCRENSYAFGYKKLCTIFYMHFFSGFD